MTSVSANGNAKLYDGSQVEAYISTLFRHVDWEQGQVLSLLGIGEKGTAQEGTFRERQIVPPGFVGVAHGHLKRWADHLVAGFIVPAVLHGTAQEKGDVTLDKVAALTALILDLDSGDISAKLAFAATRLGPPSMTIASGGATEAGEVKVHAYWLFNEPSEEVERVAALRKMLAAKVGGDQSFGRATQVIRIPGSVHAKNGKAAVCSILTRTDADYSLDDLADVIEDMEPMPGLPVQTVMAALPFGGGGMMDFSPRVDTAAAAMHRDVAAGGDDLTRWSEFSKVAGFNISCVRQGSMTPEAAYAAVNGWTLTHMQPTWPQARIDQEFNALVRKDIENHGPFPQSLATWSGVAQGDPLPLEYFDDIQPSLTNSWLVRDLMQASTLVVLYGQPGGGKSFLAIDWSLRLCLGLDIDGHAVKRCPVIYVAAEGQPGVRRRVDAFRRSHDTTGALFAMVPCAVDLLDPNADLPRLLETIRSSADRLGGPPGLIVIDTIARTFGAGDENTSAMSAYVNNLERLKTEFQATVMAIHHPPKDQLNDTLRGHGSLTGAADTILRVTAGQMRSVTIIKQKDGEEGPFCSFDMTGVQLGVDEDDEPVTSAVVKYLVASTDAKLPAAATDALAALGDAIAQAGGGAVLEGAWRDQFLEMKKGDAKEDSIRKGFNRSRDRLVAARRVSNEQGRWSIVPQMDPANEREGLIMDFSMAAGKGR